MSAPTRRTNAPRAPKGRAPAGKPMPEERRTANYWRHNRLQGAQGSTGWRSSTGASHKLTSRQRRRIDHKARAGRAE